MFDTFFLVKYVKNEDNTLVIIYLLMFEKYI